MKLTKAFISIALTVVLIWLLSTKFGSIPPIGAFLNPSSGFWQNAESKHFDPAQELKITGLQDKVVIKYDEHRIPHIFAQNDHDVYLAQGYVTAHDRLWEMDIQTRKAAGRLSEIIGPAALDVDKYTRQMGMVYGAENTLKGIMKDPASKMMVEAYTEGVNNYIHSLKPKDYPIEFKLLDYAPEDWQPINCAYLLKLMSQTLASGSDQFAMTNDLKRFGTQAMNDLFPDYPFHEDPIVPSGTKWNFKPLPVPQPSASFIGQINEGLRTKELMEGVGSNNWAVNGSKTKSGYPILANDPHLDLTFPSIWYQLQMSAPGVNVYGASLPGAPGIIIGYNQHIAWGVTNVDADVLDWYMIKFKDQSKNEYWYNGQWNKIKRRIEVINIRGQKPFIDTVLYTHHGPIVYDDAAKKPADNTESIPVGTALRWIAHDESDEFKTFYQLNRGKNYDDYRKALTYFSAPAQNFIFASGDNDIAITPNGKYPLKYKDQGKYLLDGSSPQDDWQGWIPADQNPTVKNPPVGFVHSANQSPADTTYPYYINWRFDNYFRAKRISDKLAVMKNATADTMRIMQLDNYSTLAHDALPSLLKYVDTTKLDKAHLAAFDSVKKWNLHYAKNSIGASIFDTWWDRFYYMVWDDKFGNKSVFLKYPSKDRTVKLLVAEPNSRWFDNSQTSAKETCADIVNQSFVKAIDSLTKWRGGGMGEKWQWGSVKRTFVNHLANLPGFGTGEFMAGGRSGVINALRNNNGPSWRMVVQLGPDVKGYGVFPGGESGNPGSFYYKDMFETWRDGQLNELLFLKSADEASDRVKATLTLR